MLYTCTSADAYSLSTPGSSKAAWLMKRQAGHFSDTNSSSERQKHRDEREDDEHARSDEPEECRQRGRPPEYRKTKNEETGRVKDGQPVNLCAESLATVETYAM